jgi:hypothetical protein
MNLTELEKQVENMTDDELNKLKNHIEYILYNRSGNIFSDRLNEIKQMVSEIMDLDDSNEPIEEHQKIMRSIFDKMIIFSAELLDSDVLDTTYYISDITNKKIYDYVDYFERYQTIKVKYILGSFIIDNEFDYFYLDDIVTLLDILVYVYDMGISEVIRDW